MQISLKDEDKAQAPVFALPDQIIDQVLAHCLASWIHKFFFPSQPLAWNPLIVLPAVCRTVRSSFQRLLRSILGEQPSEISPEILWIRMTAVRETTGSIPIRVPEVDSASESGPTSFADELDIAASPLLSGYHHILSFISLLTMDRKIRRRKKRESLNSESGSSQKSSSSGRSSVYGTTWPPNWDHLVKAMEMVCQVKPVELGNLLGETVTVQMTATYFTRFLSCYEAALLDHSHVMQVARASGWSLRPENVGDLVSYLDSLISSLEECEAEYQAYLERKSIVLPRPKLTKDVLEDSGLYDVLFEICDSNMTSDTKEHTQEMLGLRVRAIGILQHWSDIITKKPRRHKLPIFDTETFGP